MLGTNAFTSLKEELNNLVAKNKTGAANALMAILCLKSIELIIDFDNEKR